MSTSRFSIIRHETVFIKDDADLVWSWDIYVAQNNQDFKGKAIAKTEKRYIPWFKISSEATDEIIEKCKIKMSR